MYTGTGATDNDARPLSPSLECCSSSACTMPLCELPFDGVGVLHFAQTIETWNVSDYES